jgi:hypothetical protein
MAKSTAPADPDVLSLKVTLRNIRPPIWRRILMSSGMTLGDLNLAIQATIGWGSSHLHAFKIGDRQFGDWSVMDDVVENTGQRLVRETALVRWCRILAVIRQVDMAWVDGGKAGDHRTSSFCSPARKRQAMSGGLAAVIDRIAEVLHLQNRRNPPVPPAASS